MSAKLLGMQRQLHALFHAGTAAGLSDAELIDRFLDGPDEAAFETLVLRHGPMVLATCRRELVRIDDVEDAFQATFFVLARKAGTLRRGATLGGWLHRVARNASTRARLRSKRREARERLAVVPRPVAFDDDSAELGESIELLREELAALPDRLREPVVLCHLEGLTHDEAAARLGCPVGTVRSRLARAREQLRKRLTRRGVAPSAALPASLVGRTVQAGLLLRQGNAAAVEALSGPALTLTGGIIQIMFQSTYGKFAAVIALALVALIPLVSFADRRKAAASLPSPAVQAEPRGDWKDLAGDWDVLRVETAVGRRDARSAGFDQCRVVAPGREFRSGRAIPGCFVFTLENRLFCQFEVRGLQPWAAPSSVDLVGSGDFLAGPSDVPPPFGSIAHRAIYRRTGDLLIVCVGKAQGEKPKTFSAAEGMLITLRRDSTSESSATPSPAGVADRDDLQGNWSLTYVDALGPRLAISDEEFDECGFAPPPGPADAAREASARLAGRGRLIFSRSTGSGSEHYDFEIGGPSEPGTMNLRKVYPIVPSGVGGNSSAPVRIPAIYRVVGDEMLIRIGKPNGPRPVDFNAASGTGSTLMKLVRRNRLAPGC